MLFFEACNINSSFGAACRSLALHVIFLALPPVQWFERKDCRVGDNVVGKHHAKMSVPFMRSCWSWTNNCFFFVVPASRGNSIWKTLLLLFFVASDNDVAEPKASATIKIGGSLVFMRATVNVWSVYCALKKRQYGFFSIYLFCRFETRYRSDILLLY